MQSAFHFLPKVFSGAEVRAPCKALESFHVFMELALCTKTFVHV